MSVTLNSIDLDENGESLASLNISNGTWADMVTLGEEHGVEGSEWDGHHDPVTYSPETLRGIAEAVLGGPEKVACFYADLISLAAAGGAELS